MSKVLDFIRKKFKKKEEVVYPYESSQRLPLSSKTGEIGDLIENGTYGLEDKYPFETTAMTEDQGEARVARAQVVQLFYEVECEGKRVTLHDWAYVRPIESSEVVENFSSGLKKAKLRQDVEVTVLSGDQKGRVYSPIRWQMQAFDDLERGTDTNLRLVFDGYYSRPFTLDETLTSNFGNGTLLDFIRPEDYKATFGEEPGFRREDKLSHLQSIVETNKQYDYERAQKRILESKSENSMGE